MLDINQLNDLNQKGELSGVFDVDERSYHEGPGLSRSDLSLASKSAAHYYLKNYDQFESNPNFVFGSAFHTLMLEPDLFDSRFVLFDKVDRRKKDVKEAITSGLEPISIDDYDRLHKMKDNLLKNEIALNLISNGKPEQSCYWRDEKTNLLLKARADLVIEDEEGGILVDLKTTKDASVQSFRKDMVNYWYDLQAAHYLQGFSKATGKKFDHFVFLCVEKSEPHLVAMYRVIDQVVDNGKEIQRELIDRIAKHINSDIDLTGYPTNLVEVDIASWGYRIEDRIGLY